MKINKIVFVFPIILLVALSSFGAERPVENWLIVQPKVFNPAFSKNTTSNFDYFTIDMKSILPEAGQKLIWDPGQSLVWRTIFAEEGNLPVPSSEGLFLSLAATYVEVGRWQKGSIEVKGDSAFQIFLDGNLIGENTKTPLTLTRGKHRLMIASVQERSKAGLKVDLHLEAAAADAVLKISTDPMHNLTLTEALTFPRVMGADVAPDGQKVAAMNREGGLEIRLLPEGQLTKTIFLNGRITSSSWSPDGGRIAVTAAGEKTLSDLWVINLENGAYNKILSDIEGMSGLHWHPDGKFVMFASRVPPPKKGPYDLVDNFFDRWDGWKSRAYLWMASVETGVKHMITGGPKSMGWFTAFVVSPDGDKVVFIDETPSARYPYRIQKLWMVNLIDGAREMISEIKTSMISSIIWSPDSSRLAAIAPYYHYPESPADVAGYHSRWHQGIQLWDLSNKTSQYLTNPEFDPSVQSIWWHEKENQLYFRAIDRTVHRLYRFSNDLTTFSEVKLPFVNIQAFYGSQKSDAAVLQVAETARPSRLVSLNLRTLESQNLLSPAEDFLASVRFGKTEMFYCKNREGTQLDGWLYFPPDFDPGKKYPAIIAYYGGVLPKDQSFDSTNHWLAGNGYIVLSITPRGAWGYGREFADAHLNEWGTTSTPDIIDAVKTLIKEKPYIDPERIGGFGGSYGGFEGLSLATQTDIFATIIASGVISNTLNYSFVVLGQTNYGEIVLPGVYPWNRKDVYVDRSPVFNADKINTPILLQQGTDDPWCEMTESDQMYSALKVQGKDVVQIRWNGEGHGVRNAKSRIQNYSIMLEWFDKYLKDEPEGWQARYHKSRDSN